MCLSKIFNGKGQQKKLDSEKIGDLEQLSTENRDNLVAAVNVKSGMSIPIYYIYG